MRYSTKAQHVILAMIDIAFNGPISIQKIAQRQGTSTSYMEFLMARLRKFGMVFGFNSIDGNYKLHLTSDRITIGDIVYAIEGTFPRRSANDPLPSCDRKLVNFLREVAEADVKDTLNNIKLADICKSKLTHSISEDRPLTRTIYAVSDNQNTLPDEEALTSIPCFSPGNSCSETIHSKRY